MRTSNRNIVRGLLLRRPGLDLVRVQEVGLTGASDDAVLAWAAEQGRIVLTHDRATMSRAAYARVAAEEPMTGVFLIGALLPIADAIAELNMIVECSEPSEWRDVAANLPL